MTTPVLALLLADGRFPSGAHAHSGGMEQACDAGVVVGLEDLGDYVRGRLHTSGVVAMHAAAGACRVAARADHPRPWSTFRTELDARMVSPAARSVARHQGSQLLRAARRILPSCQLDELAGVDPSPHLPVVQGVVATTAGMHPGEAASLTGYSTVSSHCSAAIRLLGLDPAGAARVIAELAREIDELAVSAVRAVSRTGWSPTHLPSLSSPVADLLGEIHFSRRERLFAS